MFMELGWARILPDDPRLSVCRARGLCRWGIVSLSVEKTAFTEIGIVDWVERLGNEGVVDWPLLVHLGLLLFEECHVGIF